MCYTSGTCLDMTFTLENNIKTNNAFGYCLYSFVDAYILNKKKSASLLMCSLL